MSRYHVQCPGELYDVDRADIPEIIRQIANVLLESWLIPNIDEMMLQDVNNGKLKTLVTKMVNAGLSAKTVNTY